MGFPGRGPEVHAPHAASDYEVTDALEICSHIVIDGGWTEELARFCQVWIILLASSICLRKGSHLAVDYRGAGTGPAEREERSQWSPVV